MEMLRELQSYPLDMKIKLTKQRIREWINEFGEDGVYVSFSGGKDSTVLLDIVRQDYPNVPAVFVDTGLEFPEIRQFVRRHDNVEWLKPKKNFRQVIQDYGYPFVSKDVAKKVYEVRRQAINNGLEAKETNLYKRDFTLSGNTSIKHPSFCKARYAWLFDSPFQVSHMCCNIMKKNPAHKYSRQTGRVPFIGQMASESSLRTADWLKNGCNGFDKKNKASSPMSFWLEQDVLLYIYKSNLPICSVYGDIVVENENEVNNNVNLFSLGVFDIGRPILGTTLRDRTGCMFCGFGCHLEKTGHHRFELLKKTHPKIYDYIMRPWDEGGLNYKEVIDWLNEHTESNRFHIYY